MTGFREVRSAWSQEGELERDEITKPVMLYSISKDSSVMLHPARRRTGGTPRSSARGVEPVQYVRRGWTKLRVLPLSNRTEIDVWQYIHSENIPTVPLYHSGKRPVVERDR